MEAPILLGYSVGDVSVTLGMSTSYVNDLRAELRDELKEAA